MNRLLQVLPRRIRLALHRHDRIECWCELTTADAADLADLLYEAWAVIANANEGNWEGETPEWKAAAERWRDRWHATLPTRPIDRPRVTSANNGRQVAHDAVYRVLRQHPPRSTGLFERGSENARVWRAVEAALDAMETAAIANGGAQ